MNSLMNIYVKTKHFFYSLYLQMKLYQLRRDYNHLNVKEPMDDLTKLTIYEEEHDLHEEILYE